MKKIRIKGKIKDKGAVSHIEMAISFTMFILFVFFLLFYLKPVRSQNISDVLIDAVINSLEENATMQLIEIPLTLKTAVGDCFLLENPFDTINPQNMFVRDSNENPLKFALEGGSIKIEESGNFYYIFFSEEIFLENQLGLISCTELNPEDYEYAAAKTYKIYSISRLEEIKQDYDGAYEQLKMDFNFPVNYDFTVKIVLLATKQEIVVMETTKPEKVEVIAREIPIEIIQRDGSMLRAIANIQVW